MTHAAPTSAAAFAIEEKSGNMAKLRARIVALLSGPDGKTFAVASAAEIASHLGVPRDSVSPRMAELVALDVVEPAGYGMDTATRHRVKVFRATGRPARAKPKRTWTGAQLIAQERRRQVEEEKHDTIHDAQWTRGQMAVVASILAVRHTGAASLIDKRALNTTDLNDVYGWHCLVVRGQDAIRDLTKAGALIAAEIDRLKATQVTA